MLNKCIFMGRLVEDPELRVTEGGTQFCAFRLAVERDRKNKNGERDTDFLQFVAWGTTAEFISKHFGKGEMMAVESRAGTRSWQDKEGHNRVTTEFLVTAVYFGGSEREQPTQTAYANGYDRNDGYQEIEDDGDLPF